MPREQMMKDNPSYYCVDVWECHLSPHARDVQFIYAKFFRFVFRLIMQFTQFNMKGEKKTKDYMFVIDAIWLFT